MAMHDPVTRAQQIDRVNLESFRVDQVALASPPEHVGLLPGSLVQRVYVSQEHPVGRMTFLEVETGDAKTLTGYELNSRIE